MTEKSAMAVFQDLSLRGPGIKRATLSQALDEMAQSDELWTRNKELEENLHTGEDDGDAMAFNPVLLTLTFTSTGVWACQS